MCVMYMGEGHICYFVEDIQVYTSVQVDLYVQATRKQLVSFMESSSKESKAVMGEATNETLRKFFMPLLSAVMMGDVPLTLYSKGLIDQRVLEFYTNSAHDQSQKGTRIVMHLQNVLRVKPSLFETFCNILSENSEKTIRDLAKELKGNCK